ncbi:hypothetical protein IWQ62_002346 [Dispira parvispora]|uniref:Uncharacterized protein n=1 Tax=Dispira parvispora TaxID=1520584 RepID=A0A9W8AQ67_9FUNG|nr:hypothetical protein IWQ62_002346 [Dispira parvispora]
MAGKIALGSWKTSAWGRKDIERILASLKTCPTPVLDRLVRYLASLSGTDKTLMLIQYASKLVEWYALRTKRLGLASATTKLATPIGDCRTVLRFSGLVFMLQYMQAIERSPLATPRLQWLARAENLCNVLYYPLEHGYWLGAHRILPGITSDKANTLSLWSCRAWAMYTVLHFVTLWEEYRQLGVRRRMILVDKNQADPTHFQAQLEQCERQRKQWGLALLTNTAYFPLAIHWSLRHSRFPDWAVGVCGTIAAMAQLAQGWSSLA